MRREISRLAVLSALALIVAGCEEITDFPEGGVDVRAAHAIPTVRTETIDFTANVAVDNFSNRLVFVDPACGYVIERLSAGVWSTAYRAPCETTFAAPLEVEPQTSRIFTVTAFVALREVASVLPSGTYRAIVPIEAEYSRLRRQVVPLEDRTSNAFGVP